MTVNRNAIHGVRPWSVPSEETALGRVRYTHARDDAIVYAFGWPPWDESGRSGSAFGVTERGADCDATVRLLGKPTPLEARTAGDELVVTVDADEQPLFDWYWPRYDWPVMLAIDDQTS